jgi:hypothetical protein
MKSKNPGKNVSVFVNDTAEATVIVRASVHISGIMSLP